MDKTIGIYCIDTYPEARQIIADVKEAGDFPRLRNPLFFKPTEMENFNSVIVFMGQNDLNIKAAYEQVGVNVIYSFKPAEAALVKRGRKKNEEK